MHIFRSKRTGGLLFLFFFLNEKYNSTRFSRAELKKYFCVNFFSSVGCEIAISSYLFFFLTFPSASETHFIFSSVFLKKGLNFVLQFRKMKLVSDSQFYRILCAHDVCWKERFLSWIHFCVTYSRWVFSFGFGRDVCSTRCPPAIKNIKLTNNEQQVTLDNGQHVNEFAGRRTTEPNNCCHHPKDHVIFLITRIFARNLVTSRDIWHNFSFVFLRNEHEFPENQQKCEKREN